MTTTAGGLKDEISLCDVRIALTQTTQVWSEAAVSNLGNQWKQQSEEEEIKQQQLAVEPQELDQLFI